MTSVPGSGNGDYSAEGTPVVSDEAVFDLSALRNEKFKQIDARTTELILSGFTHNDKVFSTSQGAQNKWSAIMTLLSLGQVTFPLEVSTKDDTEPYLIQDATELATMYGTMVETGKVHHDSGEALKAQVRSASTVAEVQVIIDPR